MHKSLMVCMLATFVSLGGCATLSQAHIIDRARKLTGGKLQFSPCR
jgi:hypothetical protein